MSLPQVNIFFISIGLLKAAYGNRLNTPYPQATFVLTETIRRFLSNM
jgi:hypothetical protein